MSTIKTNTLQNVAGTLSVPVDTVVQGSAKAWVNFNGTGTVAIRAAFNVSSITDNGTGDYTVNFTNAMVGANYSYTLAGSNNGAADGAVVRVPNLGPRISNAAIRCLVTDTTGNACDTDIVSVNIFR